MRHAALPLLLAAVLAGRAPAQLPDSTARRADSLHHAAVRRADSVAQAAMRAHDSTARAIDSAFRARSDDDARRRRDGSARWEDSLRFGRRIRVELASRAGPDSARREGTFISLTRDSVVYRPDVGGAIVAVSLGDVRGLWVSGGRMTRAQNARMGAMLGAAVFGFIGARSGQRILRTVSEGDSFDAPNVGDILPAAALGAVIGFLIGEKVGETEDWHRVWPPTDGD